MKIALTLALAVPMFITSVLAQDWQKQINVTATTGKIQPISPTHLSYQLSWDGKVKAGTVDLMFGKKDPRYSKLFLAQAWGGSTGWASVLYPFQFNYMGFLNPKNYRPVFFAANENGKRKKSNYEFKFRKAGVTGTKKSVYNSKRPDKIEKRSFSYPRTLDLFGGLLKIRSLDLTASKTYVMPFHPVGKPYLATIKVLGREQHLGRQAIKLSVSLQHIDPKMKLQAYKKLKSSTIWISDDAWRIPLEVRAAVWVGDVHMRLVSQKAL